MYIMSLKLYPLLTVQVSKFIIFWLIQIGTEFPNSVDLDPNFSNFGTYFFNPISDSFDFYFFSWSELYKRIPEISIADQI